MKLEWSPLALERVREIATYIALDKPAAAEDWIEALFETVGRLPQHPRSGRKVPELNIDRVREVMHGAYRVIYGIDERVQMIKVLTVRRGSELLKEEELDAENE